MISRFSIITCVVAGSVLGGLQNAAAKSKKTEEPAQETAAKAEEVEEKKEDSENETSSPEETAEASPEEPALVTITPPDSSSPDPAPKSGVEVRVEKTSPKSPDVDSAKIKLLTPYPAKPLAKPPVGWRFDTTSDTTPFIQEVEIAPGAKIPLSIKPHLLVPESDGVQVFSIAEPGYQSSLGYEQTATIGAILSSSILQLDESAKQLGTSIDQLQQLLISLPKPEPQAEPQPSNSRRK